MIASDNGNGVVAEYDLPMCCYVLLEICSENKFKVRVFKASV